MANIKFTNFARSLLAVGIGPGDTSISVTGGHGARFPTLGAGEYFYATLEDASNNREIVKVTARATDVLTVVRAQDNTSALSWNAGDTIALRLNAAAITDFVDTVVNTVAKTSSTGSAVVPSGTVAQRDGSPAAGYFRYNADNTAFEGYVGAVWREFVLRTSGTGSLLMPSGTTAQRDGSPAFGYTRANSTLTQMEWWNGSAWTPIGAGATGGPGNAVFFENDQTVTVDYTIPATKNAMTAGPITINTGITVTVSTGATWTVV